MSRLARHSLRGLGLLLVAVPVLGGLSVAGASTHLGAPLSTCAQAATEHRAVLVVEHGDGSGHGAGAVIRVCVSFSEDSITGEQLLARSGVQFGTGDSGQAVCQIDNQPASYPPQCLAGSAPYWALYVSRGGAAWAYSNLGFTALTVRDGDAEGFRYEGQSDGTIPPSPVGTCPPSNAPTATAAASPVRPARTPSTGHTPVVTAPVSTDTAAAGAPGTAAVPATEPPESRDTPAAVSVSSPRPPSSWGGAGWIAAILGGGLVALLVFQLARARLRSARRPPP